MVSSLRRFSQSEIAEQRFKIISFYGTHGEKATKEAFEIGRGTIHVWKKKLSLLGGKLVSLIPSSTRPRVFRTPKTDPRIVAFIKDVREVHPRLGKEKIKPLLDEYLKETAIPTISEASIGRVIKRNNLFYQKEGRLYHTPGSGYAKAKLKEKRLRIKYAPRHTSPGNIQMDTIQIFSYGVRQYVYSAIDIYFKFSLSLPYPKLNTVNTLDFFKKLLMVYPAKLKSVQTDNGLEFLGVFDDYLRQNNIPHIFSYPRCPKINAVVERYQRTLQEEFINPNLEDIHFPNIFSSKLADYLIFYNCKRVHKSLGLKSPIAYLIEKGGMSKKYWTHTIV